MNFIITILLILCSTIVSAQLNVSFNSTNSTCSANGKLSITASGGQEPYIYEIIGGPLGFNRPPQSTPIFDLLPPGNYQVEVKDISGISKVVTANIIGNYKEPTLASCDVPAGTSTATLIVKDGLSPFSYSFSTDGGGSFSVLQSSNTFKCLPNGTMVFRVTDACNNFYPCYKTVEVYEPRFTYECAPNPLGGTDFTCTNATSPPFYYGEGSIFYTAINNLGQVYTNNTGVFKGLNGCSFSISTQDVCNRNSFVSNVYCGDSTFRLGVNCVNYNSGEAHVKASGGSTPYQYKEVYSGIVSSNGDFTGLPKDTIMKFEIVDACGNVRSIELNPPEIIGDYLGCPYDGKLQLYSPISNRTDDDTCNNTAPCRYNFFPLQLECTNCTPVQKYTVNSNNRTLDFIQSFNGLKSGNYNIKISDACGNIWNQDYYLDTANIFLLSQGDYCRNGFVKILVNDSNYNTFKFYQKTPRQLLATNTTGLFTPSPNNEYYVVVENPKCKKDSFDINLKPRISATASCDSVGINTCPNISGFTYYLYDTTGTLIQTSSLPYFKNLVQGKAYKVAAKNALFPNDTIETSFRTYEIAPFYNPTNITCSSFTIEKEPEYWSWIDHHNIPLSYSLFNSSGSLVETTPTNGFDTLPPGIYTYKVSHPYCGERQNTVTLYPPEPVQICVSPNSVLRPNSSVHEFSWLVKYGPTSKKIRIKGGSYNINVLDSTSSTTHTLNLPPGKYFIETACGKDTLDLPKYNFKLTASTSGYCPGFGKIEPSGWPTDNEWSTLLNPLNYCPLISTNYELYNQYWSKVGQFTDLPSGTNYYVVMYSGQAALDTIQVTSPFYARPDLSSTLGVICSGNPKAVVELSVTGGTGPYTYELLSPPLGLMYYTYDTKAQFADLPPDNYIFRVYDRCGISSDFTASVDFLNFTPQYKRLCDGKIKLLAPQILNASYEWINAANQVVGTSFNVLTNDVGAATYTVKVTSGTCTFNKSISVPAQTQADVVANAGPDFYSFNDNAQLQGNTPPASAQKYWEQIFPSTGTTAFIDITNPTTNIDVTAYPGQYTYVWTVDGGVNSCIDYDTVTVTFYKCDPNLNYAINASGINTSCSFPDGKASVLVTPSSGNYTYAWSNGAYTSSIQNLDTGVYIVKVTDDQICTPDQFDTLRIGRNKNILNTIDIGICQGESFKVGNNIYSSSGIYKDTLLSLLGCDSIITTKLTVNPLFSKVVQKSICQGETYIFDGKILSSNGTYNATFKTIFGCDSNVTLNLSFVSQIINNLSATICSNETYSFDGKLLNQTGTYTDTSLSSIGCDSIAILNLTVNPVSVVSVSETICNGETFLFDGKTLSASGIFIDTLQNSNNCDSIVTLNLTVLPQIKTQIADKICAGQPYVFGGQNLTASGLYLDTLTSFNNCDSIVELNFTVYPVKSTIADRIICQGEIFTFDGNNLTSSGQYFATFQSVDGCDSSVTLNLTVNAISFTNINDTICANESYSFAGRSLNSSGIYKDTLFNSSGCDSTITLNLKVNELSQTSLKDSICVGDTYLFGSQLISDGGQYTLNLSNIKGCDSTVTLELLQKSMPVIELGADTFICRGIAIIIQVNAESGTSILWQDGSTSSQYEINDPGYYAITLSNLCGEYTDSLFVADGCDGCEALIPNAFTPNSDGNNDVFRPILTCSPVELNFSVFNRWGEQVFSSTDANIGWDGTFKSADAMTDVYVWQLSYSYVFDGEVKSKQDRGVVVLIR